jgi:hypothetical protein
LETPLVGGRYVRLPNWSWDIDDGGLVDEIGLVGVVLTNGFEVGAVQAGFVIDINGKTLLDRVGFRYFVS